MFINEVQLIYNQSVFKTLDSLRQIRLLIWYDIYASSADFSSFDYHRTLLSMKVIFRQYLRDDKIHKAPSVIVEVTVIATKVCITCSLTCDCYSRILSLCLMTDYLSLLAVCFDDCSKICFWLIGLERHSDALWPNLLQRLQ